MKIMVREVTDAMWKSFSKIILDSLMAILVLFMHIRLTTKYVINLEPWFSKVVCGSNLLEVNTDHFILEVG